MKKIAISLKNVIKYYETEREKIEVLNDVSIDFEYGKLYAIIGHSGCGKSTLVKILGLLDEMKSGKYYINGEDVSNLSDNKCSEIRNDKIGFIFQEFNLDPYLRAYENVIVPMRVNAKNKSIDKKDKAIKLLNKVGLEKRVNHFPRQLSGGEQQRVCIARALANDPDIILADEPTGNLDEKNESIIFEELKKQAKEGKCVIVVSHSKELKKYADKTLEIKSGNIKESK